MHTSLQNHHHLYHHHQDQLKISIVQLKTIKFWFLSNSPHWCQYIRCALIMICHTLCVLCVLHTSPHTLTPEWHNMWTVESARTANLPFFWLITGNQDFCDKKCCILTFRDKKCRISAFRDKTVLNTVTMLQSFEPISLARALSWEIGSEDPCSARNAVPVFYAVDCMLYDFMLKTLLLKLPLRWLSSWKYSCKALW